MYTRYYTVKEASEILNIKPGTLCMWIRDGRIADVRLVRVEREQCVTHMYVIPEESLEDINISMGAAAILEARNLRNEIQERLDRLEQLEYRLYSNACFKEKLNEKFRGIELY